VDVLVDGGVIAGVGSFEASAAEEVIDASTHVYPGLINTHHHLYQYFTRNCEGAGAGALRLAHSAYDIWANLNEDTVRLSSLCGMAELMKYGCTTCFDHHYVFPTARATS
jgi:cytosine/adenosine deaminase-related metal-dependent hydrolase